MNERAARSRGVWAGQIAAVFLILAIIFWFMQMRQAPMSLLKRRDCERAYADARTAAESALVDRRHPIVAGSQVDTVTCGSIRGSSQLAR